MIDAKYVSSPEVNVAEITLLGAGAYGESLVCHIGDNQWIIVDSCIDPNEKDTPLPLKYLTTIGVNPDKVIMIVCTHWHDDHIRGISKLMKHTINADLCISRAHDKKKFLRFVGMDSGKTANYSTREFTNLLLLLKERKKHFIDAAEHKLIKRNRFSEFISLSPSDYTAQRFDDEIGQLITQFGEPTTRIPYTSPNMRSIVFFAKIGNHRAILGADLEVGKNKNEGWLRILENPLSIDKKSNLFKISHHGSETSYHEDIWKILLMENPIAKLTPWKLAGNSLPEEEMLRKYLEHTPNLYMTEFITSNKQKARDSQIEKMVRQFRPDLVEIKYKLGVIRSRINMEDENAFWSVENILGAKKVEFAA